LWKQQKTSLFLISMMLKALWQVFIRRVSWSLLTRPATTCTFITEDCQHGGHLIECSLKNVRIGIQHMPKLEVGLPLTLDFLTAALTRDIGKDLDKAEK
jgi:hypothetical protein